MLFALGSVYMTLLSLFFQPVQAVASQVAISINQTMPTTYYWISDFHLNSFAQEGINVYRNNTQKPVYFILPQPRHLRGFTIQNATNSNTVFIAEDKKERSSSYGYCGNKQTYWASTIFSLKVEYMIDPRDGKTDRWYMRITEGHPFNETMFTYFRARTQNRGNVRLRETNELVASFGYDKMEVDYIDPKHKNKGVQKGFRKVVVLTIQPSFKFNPTDLIGFWNLVKKRMHRCGP